jgi:putative transposase
VVARVAQSSRQAIYQTPRPRRAPAGPARPPADPVEAAIVEIAVANPTDGYRMVTALARLTAAPAGQPQARAARDA